jgi:3-deoxy-manno-octulosonate cytidylyltransferase (CMP-KDO synthetase)
MTPSVRVLGIIPARYESKRFPGKPLAQINGRSMIQRVWEQASLAKLDNLIVATDDDRIYEHVAQFGSVIMTSGQHQSGTDRCAEAVNRMDPDCGYDIIVNIQGDQPFIDPGIIDSLVRSVAEPDIEISTLSCPVSSSRDLLDPGVVKVVVDRNGHALYFSRSPIPFLQGHDPTRWSDQFPYKKHIGTYAFRRRVIDQLAQLPSGLLEVAEQLEQLRWLEHGYTIRVVEIEGDVKAVDRPEDID